MRYFKYSISWYNEPKDTDDFETGIVCADSFIDAATKLLNDYGETNLNWFTIDAIYIEGNHCISTSELKPILLEGTKNDNL